MNKENYICTYVLSDGNPKTIMNSLTGVDMIDATTKAISFIQHEINTHGNPDMKIVSFNIMIKPKRGRKPKSKQC